MADLEALFSTFNSALDQRQYDQIGELVADEISRPEGNFTRETYLAKVEREMAAFPGCRVRGDGFIHDKATNRLGVRIIVRIMDPNGNGHWEAAEQVLATFDSKAKINELKVYFDADGSRKKIAELAPTPSPILEPGQRTIATREEAVAMYTDYMARINDKFQHGDVAEFCQPEIDFNFMKRDIPQYQHMLVSPFSAFDGLVFHVEDILFDVERQALAVRIRFTGTLVKEFMGAKPTGRSVNFAEHVFYWLEGGKFARVRAIIDWDTFRKQLDPDWKAPAS